MQRQTISSSLRLAELMGVLSIATDLGMGQPLEYALSVCIVSMRFAEILSLSVDEMREVYYLALLRHIGCNAETYTMAAIMGDELALRTEAATIDLGQMPQVLRMLMHSIRGSNQDASPLRLAQALTQGILASPQVMKEAYSGFCEVAQRLSERLGMSEGVKNSIAQVFERWDGRGSPHGLKGEQITFSMRLVSLVQDAVTFHRLDGAEAAIAMLQERKGAAYDPKMVERFCQQASQLLAGLSEDPSWEYVLALEPGRQESLTEEQFDTACQAIADFADIKSPYTLGHSTGVAKLAAEATRRVGLTENDVITLRRAGWLHDIGRVSVSAGIWGKPGSLSEKEWERVRLHPYYTERILSKSQKLAQLGALAALHHERLDGSGYHRGFPASLLSPEARILAASDVYQAMTELRPHRPAFSPEEAAKAIQGEVRAGRLDGDAVQAVLAAAGHQIHSVRGDLAAGLSEREIEVLRLMARGNTIKQMAVLLTVSPKTIDNHIQHIYNKIGVSTRAGATLFAMEQNLISPVE